MFVYFEKMLHQDLPIDWLFKVGWFSLIKNPDGSVSSMRRHRRPQVFALPLNLVLDEAKCKDDD